MYVHIPFCAERCDYCAFAIWTDRGHLQQRYVDAVVAEIAAARAGGTLGAPATVYLGGGTPSVLPGPDLARILDVLGAPRGSEVTVECNPESTSVELLAALATAGTTRISLGVQSMVGTTLASLGRPSFAGSVEVAVERIAASGIGEYSVDLVYGAVGETDETWRQTIDAVVALEPRPAHISAYALTVEPGTAIARDRTRHPDEDLLAHRYAIVDERLSAAGYRWYEISNFAIPGHESRHNQTYWSQGDYLGFGASAHSHLDGRRFRNVWHIDRYLERIERGESAAASEERLDESARRFESRLLALRTRAGVDRSVIDLDGIGHLVNIEGDRITLNRDGRMLADAVALHLRDS